MMVGIDEVKPGMVLAEDIVLPNGMVLVNGGQSLTSVHIEHLRRRTIEQIRIREAEDSAEEDEGGFDEEVGPAEEVGNERDGEGEEDQGEVEEEKVSVSLPRLSLSISEDLMSAELTIEPAGGGDEQVTVDDINEYLAGEGVVCGIDASKVRDAAASWQANRKPVKIAEIARGSIPGAGKEGELEFRVDYIDNRPDLEQVKGVEYYWQIRELGHEPSRVDPGTIIAERLPGMPPVPGKTVTGELVTIDEIIRTEVQADDSVRFNEEQSTFEALARGVAYFVDGEIGVVPVNFDASAELVAEPDMMKAELVIHPPGSGGRLPSEQQIRGVLDNEGIVHGIKEDVLAGLRDSLARGECPDSPVVVAEGDAARDGTNGSIEFLISTESSLAPRKNDDGSVDFKNVNIVNTVAKGEELAKLSPPTEGTPGKDITGKQRPCKPGSPASLPQGANTEIHPEKPDVLIAATDGNATYNGAVVEVQEGFIVPGDVDFSTGNLTYAKSVTVNGDIKAGFSVECGGDLQVSGTIEDCNLTVGGNVLCRYGFVGQGKGLIVAKGNVNVGFMKNQTIHSKGSVSIAKEALNSTILAGQSILVHGNPLSAAGGRLLARDNITVYTVGNNSNIKTTLEAGLDFTMVEEKEKTTRLLEELSESMRKLKAPVRKFQDLLKQRKKLPPKQEFLFNKLKSTLSRYRKQLSELEERKKVIETKMYNTTGAFIKIEHAAMPGTMFKIGDRYFIVKEEVVGPKTVRLIRGQVRIL